MASPERRAGGGEGEDLGGSSAPPGPSAAGCETSSGVQRSAARLRRCRPVEQVDVDRDDARHGVGDGGDLARAQRLGEAAGVEAEGVAQRRLDRGEDVVLDVGRVDSDAAAPSRKAPVGTKPAGRLRRAGRRALRSASSELVEDGRPWRIDAPRRRPGDGDDDAPGLAVPDPAASALAMPGKPRAKSR